MENTTIVKKHEISTFIADYAKRKTNDYYNNMIGCRSLINDVVDYGKNCMGDEIGARKMLAFYHEYHEFLKDLVECSMFLDGQESVSFESLDNIIKDLDTEKEREQGQDWLVYSIMECILNGLIIEDFKQVGFCAEYIMDGLGIDMEYRRYDWINTVNYGERISVHGRLVR